ncbi:MAG TPA: hypothetical protein VM529_10960 [Gemmata sp.]|nr:hypothetical protein [Gemmata sp.]
MRSRATVIGLFLLGLAAGCAESGPPRLRLSGDAKFDGQPIPYGDVVFTPDDSKKNSGPQGFANIRDGRYDTSASGGKGFAGGPTVVRVTGLTGEGGKLLCEYEYKVDLPRDDGTHNIDVPKSAAGPLKTGPDI